MGFFQASTPNLGGPRYSEAPEFRMPTMPVGPNPLAEAFGALGRSAGESFSNRIQNEMKQRMLDKVLSQVRPGMSSQEKLSLLASPELPQEQRSALQFLFEQQQAEEQGRAKSAWEREKMEMQHRNRMQQLESQQRHKETLEEKKAKQSITRGHSKKGPTDLTPEEKDGLQSNFDRVVDLYKSGSLGMMSAYTPWKTGYNEAKGELGALVLEFTNKARQLENAGHLTKADMERVYKAIPEADDTLDTIRGKLKGLAQILGLDASGLKGEKKQKQRAFAKTPPAKIFKGKKIVNPVTGETLISNGKEWVKE